MTATAIATASLSGGMGVPAAATAVFRQEWQTYRKIVDNNYLFHREAYAALHHILVTEAPPAFRFLDVACGDASATVTALAGTEIGHYHGIDLSEPALALAREGLTALPCEVTLECRDFVTAFGEGIEPADIVWIGLSLHHLRQDEKLALMRQVRALVGANGRFLVYENAAPGEETRDAWMVRWDLQRPAWTGMSPAEWDAIADHVHANDFPETDATWHALGAAAGFGTVRSLYIAPTDLFRLYCFQA